LRAARRAGHTARASAAFMSLFNGAARHRSHLENAEMTSGAARFEDGDLSGPVVNSRRQLWSVAGYLSAVVDVLFGLEADEQGLGFRPWVPVALAKGLGLGSLVCLERLVLRGRGLAVALHMEAPSPTGAWVLGRASLDGVPLGSSFTVPWSRLRDGSRLELWLEPDGRLDAAECYVPVEADAGAQLEALFAPRPVELCRVGAAEGGVLLEFTVASSEKALVEVEVLRDGALVASALPAEPGRYLDRTSALAPHRYSVRAYFVSSGHRSMPSREHLFPGHKTEVRCPIVDGESTTLRVGPLRVAEAGRYALSLLYANGNGGFTTGITCALRHAQLFEADGTSERLLSRGVLQLPHTGSWERRLESSALSAELLPSAVYWLDLDAPAESQNMSFYEHFADYTAGQGGTAGPSNRAQLFELVARPVPALGQPGT
jgi:hypothetical protein